MRSNTKYSLNQLRDYSSLFSRSSASQWIKGDLSSINFKINRYDPSWLNRKNKSYSDYLKYVYRVLEKHYRNEYVLKNSFLNKWLIHELGESDSQIFNEFRIGSAVADLVMFNGVSKVFEIKTELDSDKRLASQLKYYKKVFNQVYIIVPKSKIDHYMKIDQSVGVITFDDNSFSCNRESETNTNIDFDTIMDVFHTAEYQKIVMRHFGQLPNMTSFNQYDICKEMISGISPVQLNKYFIELMKNRNSDNSLSPRFHKELNQISLALKLTKRMRKDMINQLNEPLRI